MHDGTCRHSRRCVRHSNSWPHARHRIRRWACGIIACLRGRNAAVTLSFLGAWLSLVVRSVRDREVAGSNPVAPTKSVASLRLCRGDCFRPRRRRYAARHGHESRIPDEIYRVASIFGRATASGARHAAMRRASGHESRIPDEISRVAPLWSSDGSGARHACYARASGTNPESLTKLSRRSIFGRATAQARARRMRRASGTIRNP